MKETDITFSWRVTLKFLAVSLFAIALGVWMTRAEGIIVVLGYIFAGFGVVLLFSIPFGARGTSAPCPLCGTRVEMAGYNSRCVRCKKCDEYLEGQNKKLRQMDIQYVSKEPVFQVPLPWEDLRGATAPALAFDVQDYLRDKIITKKGPERVVPAVWPPGCCVCGGRVTGERAIAQVLKKMSTVREVEVTVICQGIPHCDAHKDGVSIARGDGLDWCLKFRSYAYRNEFRQLNEWRNDAPSGEGAPPSRDSSGRAQTSGQS